MKYHEFVKTEFNGSTIHIKEIDTKDQGVEALVNVNALRHLFGTWQGEMEFKDGKVVQSNFSPWGMRNTFQLEQRKLILEPKKEF